MNRSLSILRRSLPLSALLIGLCAGVSQAQVPGPKPADAIRAPEEVLRAFAVREGWLQDLPLLPREGGAGFRVEVSLGGARRVLDVRAFDVRTADFELLVDDGRALRRVATPPSVTFRGVVEGAAESAVAASLVDGQLEAVVRVGGSTWAVQSVSSVVPGFPRTIHLAHEATAATDLGVRCGLVTPPAPDQGPVGPTAAVLKVAEVAIDADENYYARYGSSVLATQNAVTTVMNGVDVIYKRDVEITYQITTIVVRTVPTYVNTDMGLLLTEFRNRWNSNHGGVRRDLAHLFTGRGSFSGVIGIAYLGVVCNTGSAYGASKAYHSSLTNNVGLVSHEMGHNWNAPHCNSASPCNIMCSGLGGCSRNVTSFAPTSINTIVAYKGTRSCLSDPVTGPPALTGIAPGSVTSFDPAQVTLTGTQLDNVTRVTVGGVDAPSVTRVSSTTLRFTPPAPHTIATHPVQAFNTAGASGSLNLTVTGNHPSVLAAPVFVVRGFPFDHRVHTDRGWIGLLCFSPSNVASSLPGVVDLTIGNQFAQLYLMGALVADPSGQAQVVVSYPLDLPKSLVIHWQAITFDPANLTTPLEVSNAVGSLIAG